MPFERVSLAPPSLQKGTPGSPVWRVNVSDGMSDAMSDGPQRKAALRWQKIQAYLQSHETIQSGDVQRLCQVSPATAGRILTGLVKEGKLLRCRTGGHWAYKLPGNEGNGL